MDTQKVNTMIASLASKRQNIQRQMNKKKETISSIQNDVAKLEEQIQDIDSDIAKIKLRAEKDADRNSDKPENPMDVEESEGASAGDGAISTAALDASSSSTGGDFGGWRHHSKMGSVLKRPLSSDKSKKKKKIVEFMESFWDSIEDGK